jgi:Tfp pilus assembly protein PilO
MTTPPTGLRSLVWLLALLVVALVGLCAYQHVATGMAARAADDARAQAANLAREAKQRETASKTQAALTARIPAQVVTWSWSEQLPTMMTQVAKLTKDTGISVGTLQPAPAVTRGAITRFPLRLTLNTSLKAMAGLLKRTGEAKPVLAIDQLILRPGALPGDPLRAEMTVSSYVMVKGGKP